jgi:hypothetical protein
MSTITPGILTLRKSKPCVLVAKLDGYPEIERKLKRKTEGWFWGNILIGGIIGGVVDVASGSHKKFKEKDVYFDFEEEKIAAESGYRTYSKATAQKRPEPKQKVTAKRKQKKIPKPKQKPKPKPKRKTAPKRKQKAKPQPYITTAGQPTFARPEIDINCIISSNGKPAILVNNQIIFEGENVSGASLKRIMKNTVEFEMNGRTWQQSVK